MKKKRSVLKVVNKNKIEDKEKLISKLEEDLQDIKTIIESNLSKKSKIGGDSKKSQDS